MDKAEPMVLCKKPPCNEASKVASKKAAANDCNDWRDIFFLQWFACQRCNRDRFFRQTNHSCCTFVTSGALKCILEREFDENMVIQFFREFQILKACQHPNVVTVFSAYEVPFPAFIMELLGKTLDQSTTEQAIHNNCVLVAFNNAAASIH